MWAAVRSGGWQRSIWITITIRKHLASIVPLICSGDRAALLVDIKLHRPYGRLMAKRILQALIWVYPLEILTGAVHCL